MGYAPETLQIVRAWTPSTKIKYVPGAKKAGTKSAERYDRYATAQTVGEALRLGSRPEDLLYDFEHKHLRPACDKAAAGVPEAKTAAPAPKKAAEAKPVDAKLSEASPVAKAQVLAPQSKKAFPEGSPKEGAPAQAPVQSKRACPDGDAGGSRAEVPAAARSPAPPKKLCPEGGRVTTELAALKQEKMRSLMGLMGALGLDMDLAKGLKGGGDTMEQMAERLIADRTAQLVLEAVEKEGRRVTDREVLVVLQLWAFKKNETRQNVLPEGQRWVKSDTLGLVKSRTGQWCITNATQEYPHVTQLLNLWLKARVPKDIGETFPFTSISLNSNYAARRHRDGNNVGPSLIQAFGDFSGGELVYWPDDDRSSYVEDLPSADGTVLDITQGLALFDGLRGHEVRDFEGERFSLVFFCSNKFWTMEKEQREFLTECGFVLPEDSDIGPVVGLLPPARGYTGCQSLGKMFGLESERKEKPKVWQWSKDTCPEEEQRAQALLSTFSSELEAMKVAKAAVLAVEFQENKNDEDDADQAPVKHGPLDAVFSRVAAQSKAEDSSKADGSLAAMSPPPKPRQGELQFMSEEKKRGRPRRDGAGEEQGGPGLKRSRGEEDAGAGPLDLSSPDCQPGLVNLDGVGQGTFKCLAATLEAIGADCSALRLTNFFRVVLHKSEDPQRDLAAIVSLLAPVMPLPPLIVQRAAREAGRAARPGAALPLQCAAAAGAASAARDAHGRGAEGREEAVRRLAEAMAAVAPGSRDRDVEVLSQLLRGEATLTTTAVLRALAHAFALTRPGGCGAPAAAREFSSGEARLAYLQAMDEAAELAFSEAGGSCEELVAALMAGCAPNQLFSRCPPKLGVPLLPMRAAPVHDSQVLLAKLTGKSLLVEQQFQGERVQIHRAGGCVTIFGPDQQDMGPSFSTADLDAIRSALKVKSCVLDAVLRRDSEGLFLVVFDCLLLHGRALTRQSLQQRRDALGSAVAPCEFVQVAPCEEFSVEEPASSEDVAALLEQAASQGCSSLLFKCLDGEYEAGRASEAWLAIGPPQPTQSS